jgi:hypothetical protein
MLSASILAANIIRIASPFIGLREVRPNADWQNPDTRGDDSKLAHKLREMMRPAPWSEGVAYCAAFCEGVIAFALTESGATPAQVAKFRATFSPHCLTTVNTFARLGLLQSHARGAVFGGVVLWQHGSTSQGHAGLVTGVQSGGRFSTIEANTRAPRKGKGTQREGDAITGKSRAGNEGSLILRGFITPAAILALINAPASA